MINWSRNLVARKMIIAFVWAVHGRSVGSLKCIALVSLTVGYFVLYASCDSCPHTERWIFNPFREYSVPLWFICLKDWNINVYIEWVLINPLHVVCYFVSFQFRSIKVCYTCYVIFVMFFTLTFFLCNNWNSIDLCTIHI